MKALRILTIVMIFGMVMSFISKASTAEAAYFPTTTSISGPATLVSGNWTTFTVKVSHSGNVAILLTGQVCFFIFHVNVLPTPQCATPNAQGIVKFSSGTLFVGQTMTKATYMGDYFNAASDATYIQQVVPDNTSVMIEEPGMTSVTVSKSGQPMLWVYVKGVVNSTVIDGSDGIVNLFEGNQLVGSVAPQASSAGGYNHGTAWFDIRSTLNLSVGTHTIIAVFNSKKASRQDGMSKPMTVIVTP